MDFAILKLLELLETDGRQLHLLLARLTLREDVAEDLMQELFLRLQRSRQFLLAKNPRAYVKQAAIHLAFDWRRRQKRRLDVEELNVEPTASTTSLIDTLADREEIEEIIQAFDQLPKTTRDCMLLRYLQQEEYDTIAECVGKTPHQVRALCSKAVIRLRKRLRIATES